MLKQSNQAHGYYNGGSSQQSTMGGGFAGDSTACYPGTGRPVKRNYDGGLAQRNAVAKAWHSNKKKHSGGGGAGYSNGGGGAAAAGGGDHSYRYNNGHRYQDVNSPSFGDDGFYGMNKLGSDGDGSVGDREYGNGGGRSEGMLEIEPKTANVENSKNRNSQQKSTHKVKSSKNRDGTSGGRTRNNTRSETGGGGMDGGYGGEDEDGYGDGVGDRRRDKNGYKRYPSFISRPTKDGVEVKEGHKKRRRTATSVSSSITSVPDKNLSQGNESTEDENDERSQNMLD